jgi:hypothetical protein
VKEVVRCDVRGDPSVLEHWTNVTFVDGTEVKFDLRLLRYMKLSDSVLELTTPHVLAAKTAELTNGGARFGSVVILPDGLEFGGNYRKWEQLNDWRIVNGSFCLGDEKSGQFLWDVGHWDVPNFPAFCALLAAVWKPPLPPKRLGGRF